MYTKKQPSPKQKTSPQDELKLRMQAKSLVFVSLKGMCEFRQGLTEAGRETWYETGRDPAKYMFSTTQKCIRIDIEWA